ncbi:MAG: AbrB/MazE/SpoVT family DNA-binding domain-containing protein [Bacteroidetes bacterium]|nr:AbrB/MazE/SpoVT family DNA-binding domain-containing protein [Bacteroidota bacterium]
MRKSKNIKNRKTQASILPGKNAGFAKDLDNLKTENPQNLIPEKDPWKKFEESLSGFSEDFFSDGRNQPKL